MPFGIDLNNAYNQAMNTAEQALDTAEDVLETVTDTASGVADQAADAAQDIADDPIGFTKDLAGAVKKGTQQFFDNTVGPGKDAAVEWLTGSLEDAGIDMPEDFSLLSMTEFGLQVGGITAERVKEKAIGMLGEDNVETAEQTVGFVHDLVTDGPAILRDKFVEGAQDLKSQVEGKLERGRGAAEEMAEEIVESTVDEGKESMKNTMEAKNQAVDAVIKMMNAMTTTQQKTMAATTR